MTFPRQHVRPSKPKRRTGLTLTELMVSVTIMVVLVAAAVPILRPLSASNKNREAARQIQVLFAEARAQAMLRGRPVGVMFDTSLDPRVAVDVQDRDAVTRLYLAEVPPMFQGTASSSCVVVSNPRTPAEVSGGLDPDPAAAMLAYNQADGVTNPFAYLTFYSSPEDIYRIALNIAPLPTVDQSLEALIPQGSSFRIRFNGTGPWYEGVREREQGPGESPPSQPPPTRLVRTSPDVVSARFRIQAAGVCMLDRAERKPAGFAFNDTVVTSAHLLMDTSVTPNRPYTLGAPVRPPLGQPLKYQILLPPQRVGTSVLELPAGAVIDMRCSGFGRRDYALGERLPGENPVILFAQNGSIDSFSGVKPNAALHLLVGTRKQMAKLDQPALLNGARVTDLTTGTLTRNSAFGNLRDGSSVWVTINNRTGAVATSDVGVIPTNLDLGGDRELDANRNSLPLNAELVRLNAIESAREFANSLNSKGGL